jgi:Fn3 associated
VNGPAGSWYLSGIQCERCHKADVQLDANAVNVTYNIGTTDAPNWIGTQGRVNHFTKLKIEESQLDLSSCLPSSHGTNCNLAAPMTLGGLEVTSARLMTGASGSYYEARPVPKAPYGLLCVECHQAYSTWTAKTVGTVGETHMTPLPGFESLVPVMDTTKFTTTKAATGQFSATFACSVSSITTATPNYYNACIAAGGKVTYVPGGMSHGTVTTILNSPHARVTGYVDAKSPSSADSTLTIKGGTLANGTVVTGQYNTHFASELGVAGSCMGCHNIHGYMEGYVETNAVNAGETLKKCTECHTSHGQGMAHPTGPGTPYPDGQFGSQESCSICHLSKKSGTEYHFLRINPDPGYNTFPSAETYYNNYGSGKFAPLNTYDSGETYKDASNNTKVYPSVALDVDIACGQCHVGGTTGKNPYGLTPPAPAPGEMVPAAYSRAFLAEKAVAMHNTNAPTPTFDPPYPYSGQPTTVTISDSGMSEGSAVAIFYTTDGTAPAVVVSGYAYAPKSGTTTQQCTNPCQVTVNSSKTIYALAAGPQSYGFTPGVAAGGPYTVMTLAKPTFLPSQGNYTTLTASVSLSGPAGATLYYTKDGSTPTFPVTGTTQQYTAPIVLNSYTAALKAIAVASGYANSAVATSGAYTFKLATPTFSNVGAKYPGSYSLTANGGSITVKLNDTNPAATICYTTNGATPTASNGVCTVGNTLAPGGTFTLNALGYYPVKAIAAAAGYANSNMVSGTYSLY